MTRPAQVNRPDMLVCRNCPHFGEKERAGTLLRGRGGIYGKPPTDWKKECLWFSTQEGRAATAQERLSVMVAGANGGRGCTTADGRRAEQTVGNVGPVRDMRRTG